MTLYRVAAARYVDGMEIRRSEDFEITYEEGRCQLIINETLSEDEGEYTVKAVNEGGSCISTAYLSVICEWGSQIGLRVTDRVRGHG